MTPTKGFEMIEAIGICAIAKEDWTEWRRVNTDLPDFPWETWRAAFEKQVSDLVASGERPIQVDTRPDDFAAWLIANKRDVGSSARADYAMFRTMQLVKNGDI